MKKKETKKVGIYKITPPTGKIYIGHSVSQETRLKISLTLKNKEKL